VPAAAIRYLASTRRDKAVTRTIRVIVVSINGAEEIDVLWFGARGARDVRWQ
jgi:hypothetical protein